MLEMTTLYECAQTLTSFAKTRHATRPLHPSDKLALYLCSVDATKHTIILRMDLRPDEIV